MNRCSCSYYLALFSLLSSFANTLRIDDSDAKILYQGAWTNGHEVLDNTSQDWDHTVHYSNSSGATATLTFTGELC